MTPKITFAAASVMAAIAALATAGPALADPVQWDGNNHWYQFFGEAVTAEEAFALAAAQSYNGLQGHLVTVTSAAENAFVAGAVSDGQLVWMGGSDGGGAVNDWTWRVGPEAGEAFAYANWAPGEPNDCCGGENFVHLNWTAGGLWNDHGGPGNASQKNGFVVEFSTPAVVPEPQTYALMLAGLLGLAVLAPRRRTARKG